MTSDESKNLNKENTLLKAFEEFCPRFLHPRSEY
jgi:hypothetical protein